jgi:hypothetical protein
MKQPKIHSPVAQGKLHKQVSSASATVRLLFKSLVPAIQTNFLCFIVIFYSIGLLCLLATPQAEHQDVFLMDLRDIQGFTVCDSRIASRILLLPKDKRKTLRSIVQNYGRDPVCPRVWAVWTVPPFPSFLSRCCLLFLSFCCCLLQAMSFLLLTQLFIIFCTKRDIQHRHNG